MNNQDRFEKAEFKYHKFGILLKNLNPKESVLYDLIINCYLLQISLSKSDPFKSEFIKGTSHSSLLLEQFLSNMKVIELSNSRGNCEVIVFPLVRECHEISLDFQEMIDEQFEPKNPEGLLYHLIDGIEKYVKMFQTKAQMRAKLKFLYSFTDYSVIQKSKFLIFIFAIVLNVVMLSDGKELDDKFVWNSGSRVAINLLLASIVFFSILNILWINYTYLPVLRIQHSGEGNQLELAKFINHYLYIGASFYWHVIFSLVAWFKSPYFLTLHLLPSLNLFKSTKFIMK